MMKHRFLFFTFAIMLFATLPCQAQTYDFSAVAPSGQVLYYKIVPRGVMVTDRSTSYGTSLAGNLIIPDTVAYNGNNYSVTSIGSYAFSGCSSLTSVTIPNSVTSIGEHAFQNCFSLASVTIPDSVTSIGSYAFSGCSSLTRVTIPNSVTSIESYAFSECSSLTSVTIPSSVTSIKNSGFSGCSSLTSITIPNSVTSIGNSAFSGCSSLTSVTIHNSVTSIESYAFSECSSLTSVTIPDSVTSIGSSAFSRCSSLTSVTIPNSVISIESSAFYGCSSLTSVTIPNSVTSIGNSAFSGCSSLTSVTIPNSVTSIGEGAFSCDTSMTSMVVSTGNPVYDSRNNCNALIETLTNTLIAGCKNTVIPNSVTSIGEQAFQNCFSLTSVTIPNSVTSIGGYAFYGCSSLTSVTIPNSVTSIGNSVFSGCSSLTSVTIPNSVTSIESYAFNRCSSLTSVTIPNSVTSIGNSAFYGCSSLTSVTIPNSVIYIESGAFYYCSSLTSVTIPNSVTSIGISAFFGCSIDTLYMGHFVPSYSSIGLLQDANIIFIPCGAMANYINAWSGGASKYHEPDANITLSLSASIASGGTAEIIPQDGHMVLCSDSSAVLQATANYGYHFVQWNNGNTANPDTLYLTGDSTVTAIFDKNQYTLSVSGNNNTIGSVSGSGVFEYLDTVTITASVTAPHHHFVQWSDGVTDTLRNIVITQDLSLMAIFAIDTHYVAVAVNQDSYGTVSGAGEFPYGSTATLTPNPENGYYFVHWINGDTTNPNIFVVTGDTLLSALFAPEIVPSICMVSVDNDRNVLSWEKEQCVSGYNIYREGITSNMYELLATIPYDSLSVWTDTSSRPRTRSYRYRLSATDTYGHEADMSDIHNTMHLTISQVGNQWNLVWTEYEGTDYTTYVIYRGSDASSIHQIDMMPSGGNTSYTDVNAPAGDVYYQVGIMLSSPCNPSKNNYMVLSNIATNSTVGIPSNNIDNINVFAHNGHLIINSSIDLQDVRIYDITGKLLKTVYAGGNTADISISDFAAGIYMVQICTGNGTVTRKVVK